MLGFAKVQVDASSVTGEDTFTRITVEAVHLAVHLLVVAHRVAVRQEAAIVRRERVPFVEVPANVCPPVTIVSIVTALAHVRLVVEEVIIGLQGNEVMCPNCDIPGNSSRNTPGNGKCGFCGVQVMQIL